MSGLFGDPWNPGKTVEPDLLRLGAGDPTPPSDQDLTDAATVAYVQAYVAGVMAGFQPLDSDLTAIAALSTTSFGRALLALADAAALRSTAGLVIGTDVQAHDTDLDAIAALSTTSFGRSLLALADAAALTATVNSFTSTLKGLAPASGGGTVNFLRADGTWAAPGGGTTTNSITFNNAGAGAASGTSFNGSAAVTISTNSIGALNLGGGTLTGKLITVASAAGGAGLNLPHGAAPTVPANGDVWTTTAGIFWRLNGATVQVATGGGTATGTNTGDQTITLTGAVTGSGLGSFATTLAANIVALSNMATVATGTVFYRKTAGTGNPEVQSLATLKTDLGLSGTNSGDQFTAMTSSRFLGRVTAGFGAAEELTSAQAKTLLAITAPDVSGLATVATSGSASDLGTGTLPQARVADYQCGNMEFHLKITGLFLSTQQITNVTTVASTADRYQVHPWTPSRDVVIQNIGVEVTTLLAASNAKVVVHDTDPTTGGPNNVLFETANLSCAAVGYVSETRSFTFQKGVTYWVGVRTSSTQSLRAYSQTAARNIGQTVGTGIPQNALQKTLTFATAAPAWGAVTTGQFVGGNPLAVIMQLA